jgi:hypothetical protein
MPQLSAETPELKKAPLVCPSETLKMHDTEWASPQKQTQAPEPTYETFASLIQSPNLSNFQMIQIHQQPKEIL